LGCVRYVFFFQAEDGIRDWSVTGVQTCALPISDRQERQRRRERRVADRRLEVLDEVEARAGERAVDQQRLDGRRREDPVAEHRRSEERRVGKEGKTRWAAEE